MRTRAKSLQSFPTPCDPVEWSQLGSSVHGILQARIMEWVAVPHFRGSSQPRDRTCVSYVSCIGRWNISVIEEVSCSTGRVGYKRKSHFRVSPKEKDGSSGVDSALTVSCVWDSVTNWAWSEFMPLCVSLRITCICLQKQELGEYFHLRRIAVTHSFGRVL